jgi:hypothetical protein
MATERIQSSASLRRSNFAKPPFEVPALAIVGYHSQRSRITASCFFEQSQSPQQISASGMEQMIAVEIARGGNLLDKNKPRLGSVRHRNRHRPVQGDNRRGVDPFQKVVEPDNLRPVGILGPRGATMNCGVCRL